MSYFTDEGNGFTVYEAPKNGGTTLRLWICYAGTGEVIKSSDGAYYAGTSQSYKLLQEWGYVDGPFAPQDTIDKVCIKRDPVDRFISCFYDKVIKEGRLKVTIDDLLDNFDEILDGCTMKMNDGKTNFMKFHFAPQTYHFGSDKSYYTHVIDTKDISTELKSFLEKSWGCGLPDMHARNGGGKRKFDLTSAQIDKVKEIYSEDYENGWY